MKPNAMLVTLVPESSDFITLQTYDPVHGKSQRFYVSRPDLTSLCTADMPLMDTDLNNYLIARNYKGMVSFKVCWLSVNWQDEAAGYIQRFTLPVSCCLSGSLLRLRSSSNLLHITLSRLLISIVPSFTSENCQVLNLMMQVSDSFSDISDRCFSIRFIQVDLPVPQSPCIASVIGILQLLRNLASPTHRLSIPSLSSSTALSLKPVLFISTTPILYMMHLRPRRTYFICFLIHPLAERCVFTAQNAATAPHSPRVESMAYLI